MRCGSSEDGRQGPATTAARHPRGDRGCLQAAVGPLTFEAYCGSWVTRRAAERAVEIISEASRHLPDVLKAQEPDVPWRDIAGIGNVLRHEYHRLDDAVIYTIVTRQLGPLESAVRRLLQRLDETGAAS